MGEKNNVLVSLLVNTTGIKKDQEAGLQTPPMDWVQRDRQTARLYALIAKSEPNKSHNASYTRMDPYSTDRSTHTTFFRWDKYKNDLLLDELEETRLQDDADT